MLVGVYGGFAESFSRYIRGYIIDDGISIRDFLSGIFVGLFGVVEVECSVRGGFFVVGVERFFCSCSVGDGLFSVLFCYLGWWAVGFLFCVNLGVIELGVVGYF